MYSGKGILWSSLAYARNTNTFTIENRPCCCYKCVIQYFLNTECGRILRGSVKYKCGSLICTDFGKSSIFPFKFIASNCKA